MAKTGAAISAICAEAGFPQGATNETRNAYVGTCSAEAARLGGFVLQNAGIVPDKRRIERICQCNWWLIFRDFPRH